MGCKMRKPVFRVSTKQDTKQSAQLNRLAKVIKFCSTVKPVLSVHSKIDKTKVLKTNGSLMKVKSIAKCSFRAF